MASFHILGMRPEALIASKVLAKMPAHHFGCSLMASAGIRSGPGALPDFSWHLTRFEVFSWQIELRTKQNNFNICFAPSTLLSRLRKSESTDSLLSQASGSSGSRHSGVVTRQCQEISVSLPSVAVKQSHSRMHKVALKSSSASQRCGGKPETLKPTRESRSQKHTRVNNFFRIAKNEVLSLLLLSLDWIRQGKDLSHKFNKLLAILFGQPFESLLQIPMLLLLPRNSVPLVLCTCPKDMCILVLFWAVSNSTAL